MHVSVVYPGTSTETEFFDVMSRETGTIVTRAAGPRQDASAVADAIARAIEHPVPMFSLISRRGRWSGQTDFAPGLTDRIVKRFGRKPAR